MPFDEKYNALNFTCSESLRFAEDAGEDLVAYVSHRPVPQLLINPSQLAYLRSSRPNAISGLTHPNAHTRLASLSLFGPRNFQSRFTIEYYPNATWEFSEDCTQVLLTLVETDQDMEVRHAAAKSISLIYPKSAMPSACARTLGEVAVSTNDVILRSIIYQALIWSQHNTENIGYVPFLNPLTSLKYLRVPIFFDDEQVRKIAGLVVGHSVTLPSNSSPSVPLSWWRRLLSGKSPR